MPRANSESFQMRLEELFNESKRFAKIPHNFTLAMSADEARLLAYLCYWSVHFTANDGWFFRKEKDILLDLFMIRRKQSRLFRSLKSKSFISTKIQGLPGLRYIRINAENILRAVDKMQDRFMKKYGGVAE